MIAVMRLCAGALLLLLLEGPAIAGPNPCYATFHAAVSSSADFTPQSEREVSFSNETAREILRAAGVFRIKVLAVKGLGTACAARPSNGERIVYYDDDWLSVYAKGSKWVIIGVLAHEVGHLTNDHRVGDGMDRWRREYEADFHVGRVIAAMGGTLRNAIEAVSLQSEDATDSYPSRQLRVAAVTEGYEAVRKPPGLVQQSPEPKEASGKRPKLVKKVCFGGGGGSNCLAGADIKLGCEPYWAGASKPENLGTSYCSWIDSKGVKQQDPYSVRVYQNNDGGGCGWTGLEVTCNPR
jgi:hypothetical protein